MDNNRVLLESYCKDMNPSYYYYNEEDKQVFNKAVITKLYKSIKNKYLKVDYMDLEKCNGDITKFSKYSDLENAIIFIDRLYNSNPSESPIQVKSCVRTLELLKKYKTQFSKAFSGNNDLIEMMFVNMSATLISATSQLVTVGMDYIKDQNGKSYKAMFADNANKILERSTYFKALDKFIKMDANGDLNKFFSKNIPVTEAIENIYENNFIYNESIAGLTIAVIATIFAVIYLLREIVYMFFFCKKTLSNRMLALAYFLEMDLNNIDVSTEKGKAIYDKQTKTIEKLRHLGNSLVADQKSAENDAEDQKQEDDKNSTSSSDGDPNNGSVIV